MTIRFLDDPPYTHEGIYDHGDKAKRQTMYKAIHAASIEGHICT